MEYRRIYILLIRSRSMLSKAIHTLTKAEYTHASLGFSSDCRDLYSFARRYVHLPIPVDMLNESIEKGFLGKDGKVPCALYCIEVPVEVYYAVHKKVHDMFAQKERYGYSYLGIFTCWFGIAMKRKNKFFCSEFVAETLESCGALKLHKTSSLFRPVDFKNVHGLKLVYEGNISGLRLAGPALTE